MAPAWHLLLHWKDLPRSGSFKAGSDGLVHRANELLRGILTPVLRATRAADSREEARAAWLAARLSKF